MSNNKYLKHIRAFDQLNHLLNAFVGTLDVPPILGPESLNQPFPLIFGMAACMMCMCAYVCVWLRVCVPVCEPVAVYICACMCVYVCLYVCMCAYCCL